jgi:hypothetical protein
MRLLKKVLLFIVAVLILYGTWLMICLSLPYTVFNKYTDFLITKQLVYHIKYWRISFYIHVFISTVVLIAGFLQFSRYLLLRYPRLHRQSGKIYALVVIAISGPTGLIMGFYANGGVRARVSFVILAILWIAFTIIGWWQIKQRQWEAHANWMLRSYALTLSALTLRCYAYILGVLHMPLKPVPAYITISWLSWTINLLLAEYIIRKGILKKYLAPALPH